MIDISLATIYKFHLAIDINLLKNKKSFKVHPNLYEHFGIQTSVFPSDKEFKHARTGDLRVNILNSQI